MDKFLSDYAVVVFLVNYKDLNIHINNTTLYDVKIDYMEDIIRREKEYAKLYCDYVQARLNGVVTKRLEQFMIGLENTSKEALEKFKDNGDKYILMKTIIAASEKQSLEKDYRNYIEEFIKYSILGDSEAIGFKLSPELEAKCLINNVRQYIKHRDIKIKNIIFPKKFEATKCDIYPIKLTYRYKLIGTEKGGYFSKEVVQNFYIGFDWSEGIENGKDIIEYIKQTNDKEE